MYLWIGCKLPEAFEREIRRHCLELNQQIGLDMVAFTLPQHVSLKISFQAEYPEPILAALEAFLSAQSPFAVQILNIEQNGHILWLTVAENEILSSLHQKLDVFLEERFGIGQHAFDKCFKFHTTLFIDEDLKKVSQMYRALADYPFSRTLTVDTFLLGLSETGKAGSYRVVQTIKT